MFVVRLVLHVFGPARVPVVSVQNYDTVINFIVQTNLSARACACTQSMGTEVIHSYKVAGGGK